MFQWHDKVLQVIHQQEHAPQDKKETEKDKDKETERKRMCLEDAGGKEAVWGEKPEEVFSQ